METPRGLRCVRGASRRTARRIARATAAVAFSAGILGAPLLAGRAAAHPGEPQFAAPVVNAFGLGGRGSRQALADFDGDGDVDVFVGSGRGIVFLLNQGSATAPDFVEFFELPDLAESPAPAFANLFAGQINLVIGEQGGDILYFSALLEVPSRNPFGFANAGAFAVPAFADIDADGDLDALVGNSDGETVLFRNTGDAVTPVFAAPETTPFGLGSVGGFATPAFADIDGDGDLDAFVGSSDGETRLFRNTGDAIAPLFAAPTTNPFGLMNVGPYSAPQLVDIDGDGDLDALIGEGGNGDTVFFRNDGGREPRVFAAAPAAFFALSRVGRNAVPALADIDGDGDLDAFVGNYLGDLVFFRNTGDAVEPAPSAGSNNPFGLANTGTFAAPAFGDLDGDGDLDALVGRRNGTTAFFRNHGTAVAPVFAREASGDLPDLGDFASPALVDIDSDGDLDAFVGNYEGETIVFVNTGSVDNINGLRPVFAAASPSPFGLTDVGFDAVPAFADLDGDGDLDALIGNADGQTLVFRNDGDRLSPAFTALPVNPFGIIDVDTSAAPVFADLDRDGDLDALIGNGDGETIVLRGGPIPPPVTETPTPSPSPSPSDTPLPNDTATPTAVEEPTATPPRDSCPGDCDDSDNVSIGELITLVSIALGNQEISACLPGDTDRNQQIAIGELIAAVSRALNGCT